MKAASFALIALLLVVPTQLWSGDNEMRIEDLVEKHLNYLANEETRSTVKNRLLTGSCTFKVLIGRTGSLTGPVNFLSEGDKVRLVIRFNDPGYRGEDVVYDGKKIRVGQISPGVRSQLGDFFYRFEEVVEEGLVGGALSTAWPLLNLKDRKAKLEYGGLKKVDDRELHEVTYKGKHRGDAQSRLYFDPESFAHVLTISRALVSRAGSPTISTTRDRFTLEERFDEFRTVEGWVLPSQWTMKLSINTSSGNSVSEWIVSFDNASHNQEMNPQYFNTKE
jgi:hypothetical protein